MKTLIILFLSCLFSAVQAQTTFLAQSCETCDLNPNTNKYENCRVEPNKSQFKLSEGENLFVHLNEGQKTSFRINKKYPSNDHSAQTYEVTDEAGNAYFFLFNPHEYSISVIPVKNGKPTLILIRYKLHKHQ